MDFKADSDFDRRYHEIGDFNWRVVFWIGRNLWAGVSWLWDAAGLLVNLVAPRAEAVGQYVVFLALVVGGSLLLKHGGWWLWDRFLEWWRRKPQVFGQARYATQDELQAAGLFRPGGRFLGRWHPPKKRGRPHPEPLDLCMHGEGHCLTIAAQGGGKTTGLIIPTLLTYTAGTVIVTDPKGAITAQTYRHRASLGRVIVLNPWRRELAADPSFNLDLTDDGFNPMQIVGADPAGRAGASLLASLLLPTMPGEDPYWSTEGRDVLEWGMLWLTLNAPPERRTLPYLRDLLFDFGRFIPLLKECSTTTKQGDGWRALKIIASKLYGMHTAGAGAQLTGIVSSATTALKIYDHDTYLAEHVSVQDGFRLADLKGSEKLTIFVVCPPDHLVGDDRKWLNLTLSLMAQAVGKPGKAQETLLLIDEFPALGYLPNLFGALEQFREAGIRGHLIAQNPGQIIRLYGPDGLRELLGICETKQFFNTTDFQQAQLISSMMGERQIDNPAVNAEGETSISLVGVPLFRPEEIFALPSHAQIIIRRGLRPIMASVFPYFLRPEWIPLVDPNPYREKTSD